MPASDSMRRHQVCEWGQRGSFCADHRSTMQEKRYRSMQEHIRRAHPEHYIPKLPATEESFQLMITTAPSERSPPQPTQPVTQSFGSTGAFNALSPSGHQLINEKCMDMRETAMVLMLEPLRRHEAWKTSTPPLQRPPLPWRSSTITDQEASLIGTRKL